MKPLKNLMILAFLISAAVSSGCTTTKYRLIHVDIPSAEQIEFGKYTVEQNASMTDSVVDKVFDDQEICKATITEINDIITKHNKAHKGK